MTIKQVNKKYKVRYEDQQRARKKLKMTLEKNRRTGNLKAFYTPDQLRKLLTHLKLMEVNKNGVRYLVKVVKEL